MPLGVRDVPGLHFSGPRAGGFIYMGVLQTLVFLHRNFCGNSFLVVFVGLPEITLKLSWCIGIALSVYQGGGPGPWVLWAHMVSSLCTWGSRTWGRGFSGKAVETGDVAATQGVGFADD